MTNIKQRKLQDKLYLNFSKANWEKFTEETETILASAYHSNDIHKDENFSTTTIQNVAKKHIPAGRIMRVINEIPTDLANLMKTRDEIRQNNPSDLSLPEINQNINKIIKEHKQEKWKEHLASCQPNSKKNMDHHQEVKQPASTT